MAALLLSKAKTPKACLENVHRLLTEQKRWSFAFNEMGGAVICNGQRLAGPTITTITRWCHTKGVVISSQAVAEVIAELADAQRIHPVRDYLDGLTWDGTERLDEWLITYLGAEDTAYTRAIGRKWLISAVARVYRPGSKADHMLVLEGPQGIMKSSALAALCHDDSWFLEDLRDIHGKDCLMQFGGKWIVEIAELQGFKGAENARLKAFLSTRVDNYRPPYARVGQDFPRSIIFAGTVNEDQYLKDATGGRRFWCFECGTIDVAGLAQNRDQLWAEAVHAHRANEEWWLTDKEIIEAAQIQQENRRIEDPWEQTVADFLDGKTATTVDEILTHLETPPAGLQGRRAAIARTKADQMRVAEVLKVLGWEKKQISERRTRSWVKIATDSQPEPPEPPAPGEVVLGESRRKPRKEPPEPREPPTRAHKSESDSYFKGRGGAGGSGGSPTVQTGGIPGSLGEPPLEPPPSREPPPERVGSCAYCCDALYRGEEKRVGGRLFHARCVELLERSRGGVA